jgi:hypothetical protein
VARCLLDILFSRGFGHARRLRFLFDAREHRSVGFLRFARAYLYDVTSQKWLPANLEQGWQFQNCLHIEQLCTVDSSPRK